MTRGTTPVIVYSFKNSIVSDFTEAYLTLKQDDLTIEKNLTEAVVDSENNQIGWTLTQEETLSFDYRRDVYAQIRYKVGDSVGASRIQKIPVSAVLKEGTI